MHISERISALLDNAGDRTDQAALAAIAQDQAARQTWSRYQLIGDSLRDGEIPLKNQHFGARVAAALERESLASLLAPSAAVSRRLFWLLRPVAALAAAASLAALMFSGWYSRLLPEAPTALATHTGAPSALPVTSSKSNRDAPHISVLSEEEYQRRINSYLVNFNEQRAQLGVPGVHPYVRVVGFESAPHK